MEFLVREMYDVNYIMAIFIEFMPMLILDVVTLILLIHRFCIIYVVDIQSRPYLPYTIRAKLIIVSIWIFISALQILVTLITTSEYFWMNDYPDIKNYIMVPCYIQHLIVVCVQLVIIINESRERLNSNLFTCRIFWFGATFAYNLSLIFFFINDKIQPLVLTKIIMTLRAMITTALCFISCKWSRDYGVYTVRPESVIKKYKVNDFWMGDSSSRDKDNFSPISNEMVQEKTCHEKPLFNIMISPKVVRTQDGQELYKVYVKNENYKLIDKFNKTYEDFQWLDSRIRKSFTKEKVNLPNLEEENQQNQQDSNCKGFDGFIKRNSFERSPLERRLKLLKEYVEFLCLDQDYYIECFFNFFNIPDHLAQPYIMAGLDESDNNNRLGSNTMNEPNSGHHNNLVSSLDNLNVPEKTLGNSYKSHKKMDNTSKDIIKSRCSNQLNIDNYGSQGSIHNIEDSNDWNYFNKEETAQYCFIFDVLHLNCSKDSAAEHYNHTFRITQNGDEPISWEVTKRYNDFHKLYEILKSESKDIVYPPLPKKIYFIRGDLDQRGKELEEFLLLSLNQNMLCNEKLQKFIGLDDEGALLAVKLLTDNFYDNFVFKVNVNGYIKLTGDIHNDPFVTFRVDVKVFDKMLNTQIMVHELRRRYNDFYTLHNILKGRFKQFQFIKLPKFPKRKILFKRDIHHYRMIEFDRYLNGLLEYENQFDCVSYLKFLGIKPKLLHSYIMNNNIGYRANRHKRSVHMK